MGKIAQHKPLPRILITLLGLAIILWGISDCMLGFYGKEATAVITSIRREGGERNETTPNRYTFNIGYTFTLPDGRVIDGFTKKIGSPVFLKADGTSTTQVRYLPNFPYINALEEESGFGKRQVILIITGVFLIILVNR